MDRLLTPLLRRVYAWFGFFVAIYAGVLIVQHSQWYKERLYRKLLSADERGKAVAAFDLYYLNGEPQLVRALKSPSLSVRTVAANSLWELWTHAGGRRAYREVQSANRYLERKAYDEALAVLTQVTQRFPTFPEGWNRRATLHWLAGRFEESIADAQRAVTLNPNHFGAWQGMGLCQVRLGNLEEACRCLRAALRITPHDPSLRRLLGQCEEVLNRLRPRDRVHYDII